MQETKLISIRVPVELLEKIDEEAAGLRPMTRSGVIVNFLTAIFDTSSHLTRFLMLTRGWNKRKNYKLSFDFVPGQESETELSQTNLITP